MCGEIITEGFDESPYHLCGDCHAPLDSTAKVDNFELIKSILKFRRSTSFYFCQIIQRKKDGNDTGKGNNGSRTIRSYYFFDLATLIRKESKIKELCISNNARAYIHLNPRDSTEVSLTCISELAQHVKNGTTMQGTRIWDHACGISRDTQPDCKWLVDVDSKDMEYFHIVEDMIESCRGREGERIHCVIPTVNGYHLITSGFDRNQFANKLSEAEMEPIDIQKDNPTLLYYHG